MGDYCMPEGEVCPPPPVTCPEMTASICDETSVNCDMGGDANGCWLGDFCQPMDVECPVACWSPPVSQCGATDIGCETTACQLEKHAPDINYQFYLYTDEIKRNFT